VRAPKLVEFAQQFGGAYFSTEGALWRTLALLLARPGELTRRYLAGRRRHYVLPLRLYLTISLITLVALRLTGPQMQIGKDPEQEARALGERPSTFAVLELGNGRHAGMKDGRFYCERLPDWLCTRLRSRMELDAKGLARELQLWPERFLGHWGTAMFVLVPIFAALYKLLYLGSGLRYTEHLVFALHEHSFWFGAIAFTLLPLPGAKLALLTMPVHALLAARRVYGGGWAGTALRALAVAILYGLAIALALAVVAVWSFLAG